MLMSPDQARVVDPILTEHARGYTNAEFIWNGLFPTVTMPTRAAKRIEFGRDSFKRPPVKRAPGAQIGQMDFGYEGKNVALTQRALSAKTPVEHLEEAAEVPGIDLQRMAVDLVLNVIALDKEIEAATIARNAALYPNNNKIALTDADKWSDAASDPLDQLGDYRETIRKRIGKRPNTLAVGGALATALSTHPKIRDHFKYTTSSTVTVDMLKAYFQVDNLLVGDAIYDQQDGTSLDIWGGDAILAYVAPASTAGQRNMALPSYGYTYQLRGHPFVQPPVYVRDFRSWFNDVFDEYSPELVGADAGFLIQNAL
ncbi:MAG: major capsid protein [Sphingomonas sp.]|uniref:major capsid protein n=1 Tax=Sphingomonas sp. TaxID=28214 RepID=UPI0025D0A58C|nr:major capsid protein [Sphingomonas sp.]MBX9881261.1 major capsid protein [Sphingomonas sp.]